MAVSPQITVEGEKVRYIGGGKVFEIATMLPGQRRAS